MDPNQPRLVINKDMSEARLVADAGLSRAAINAATLRDRLRGTGIEITQFVIDALARFEAGYHGRPLEMVVAKATPALKGADGRIEFLPQFDPTKPVTASDVVQHAEHDAAEAHTDTPHQHAHAYHGPARRDHYAGKAHVHVTEGTRVGTLLQPEQGTPGRDVLGNATACLGAPCPIRIDDSLRVESSGAVVVAKDGVLNLVNNVLSVSQVLEIPGALDFTIGHVDVEGDVRIGNGVRPGFKIRATGAVTIKGLVEVGDITCGELAISGGIAGAGRGELHVAKDVHFNYADGIKGVIGQNLFVASELTNCHLVIGEDLKAPGATIFGGEIAVTGSLQAKVLGSEAFRPTTLVLGEVPLLLRPRRELLAIIATAEAKVKALQEEEKLLKANTRLNAPQRERLTEFAYHLSEAERAHAVAVARLAEVDLVVATKKKLQVEVSKAIHPKVRLVVGEHFAEFTSEVKGPVKIMWNEAHELVCQFASGAVKPLSDFATIQCRINAVHAPYHHSEPGAPPGHALNPHPAPSDAASVAPSGAPPGAAPGTATGSPSSGKHAA